MLISGQLPANVQASAQLKLKGTEARQSTAAASSLRFAGESANRGLLQEGSRWMTNYAAENLGIVLLGSKNIAGLSKDKVVLVHDTMYIMLNMAHRYVMGQDDSGIGKTVFETLFTPAIQKAFATDPRLLEQHVDNLKKMIEKNTAPFYKLQHETYVDDPQIGVDGAIVAAIERAAANRNKPLDLAGYISLLKTDSAFRQIQQYINLINQPPKRLPPTVRPGVIQAAKTPKEFLAVLDEKFSYGVMSDEQYFAFRDMIEKYNNAERMDADKIRQQLHVGLNELSWKKTETNQDIHEAKRLLDDSHAGMEKPKKKILNTVAITNRLKREGKPPLGEVICFVGPPGVGKTSLGMSVAEATGRKFGHVALGGVHRESEIRGFQPTYVGSIPGRIIKGLAKSGSMNPVILLDEIDKLGKSADGGNPADALLEVLDPKQNKNFRDHFVEVPVDLSDVLFIITANYLEQIPEALRDRIDIIELEPYDLEEKLEIASSHLVKKVRSALALSEEQLTFTPAALRDIVDRYTYEAGVRSFDRYIKEVATELIMKMETGQAIPAVIDTEQVREMLGPSKVRKPQHFPSRVGLVPGLYVAGAGGGVGYFQAVKSVEKNDKPDLPGKLVAPQLVKNRNLQDMSQDALERSFTFVRMHAGELGIELPQGTNTYVELSTLEGGKMDGNSAGAAKTVAIVSTLTNRPIRDDIAMTGTCTIQGDVLAIGGVKQKLRGAMDTGKTKLVFIPKQNLIDLIQLPERMKAKLKVMVDERQYSAEDLAALKNGFEVEDAANISSWLTRDKQETDKMAVVLVDNVKDVLKHALLPAASTSSDATYPTALRFSGAKKPLSLVG